MLFGWSTENSIALNRERGIRDVPGQGKFIFQTGEMRGSHHSVILNAFGKKGRKGKVKLAREHLPSQVRHRELSG